MPRRSASTARGTEIASTWPAPLCCLMATGARPAFNSPRIKSRRWLWFVSWIRRNVSELRLVRIRRQSAAAMLSRTAAILSGCLSFTRSMLRTSSRNPASLLCKYCLLLSSHIDLSRGVSLHLFVSVSVCVCVYVCVSAYVLLMCACAWVWVCVCVCM